MKHKRLPALLALLLLLALPAETNATQDREPPKITVQYYYSNACGSCNETGVFYEHFKQAIGSAGSGVAVEVLTYNTFQTLDEIKYHDACRQYDIPKKEQSLPLVIVNGAWLSGKQQINERIREVFLSEKAKLLAREKLPDASTLLYFYVSPCDECAVVKQFMDTLEGSYPVSFNGETVESPLSIISFNAADPEGLALVKELFIRYKVPGQNQKAPILFLRDSYLSGEKEITGHLVEKISNGDAVGTEIPGSAASPIMLTAYEWPGIFLTGLANGFNPCSVSMLLFLIALLLARNASVMKLGLCFIAGKTVAYLALGTVLFSVLLTIDNSIFKLFQDAMKYVMLALVLIVAAVNVSDFVAAKNEKYNNIRMQLPIALRRLNHQWIRRLAESTSARVLLPAVFVLGLLVSTGEFLCTGQIYLATILYLIKRSPALDLQTFGAFLIYIAGMMIPLIVLTAAVWKGRAVFKLTELARRNMPAVKLVTAAVFVAFAAVLLLAM